MWEVWWTSETWTSLYILHRSTNLISLYIHCDVLLTALCCLLVYVAGCGYIHICKHTQKRSSTTANARAAWLYGMWKDWGRRGPFGWFSWEGNDLAGTFYFILSELKPHELWCSDPILSAGTRGSDMILEWSYDLRSTSARASHVLPQSFSVQKRSVSWRFPTTTG